MVRPTPPATSIVAMTRVCERVCVKRHDHSSWNGGRGGRLAQLTMITGTPGMSDDNELRVESWQRGMKTLHTLAAVGASAAAPVRRVATPSCRCVSCRCRRRCTACIRAAPRRSRRRAATLARCCVDAPVSLLPPLALLETSTGLVCRGVRQRDGCVSVSTEVGRCISAPCLFASA
jgi:hypothetical protein